MIHYKSEKQARLAIGVTMFIYAFFSTAYVQLTSPILSYIVEAEGYIDPILTNMIVTVCALAQIPACLVGVALGKRMDKKLWSYIGMACFLIGSLLVIPLSGNIWLVLVCRFVVGFGSGLLIVLSTGILPDFYEGKSLSVMMGLVTSGSGFWGFVFSNLQANVCGAVGWKRAYLVHLYALVPLLLFFLLVPKRPLVVRQGEEIEQSGKREKEKLSPAIFLYALLGALLYMGIQIMWSNTSLWMRDTLGGAAAQMGLVSGFFSLLSCAVRLVFGPMFNRLGKGMLHVSVAVLALGLLLGGWAQSFGMALLAGALVGAAMGFTAPTCLNLAIQAAPENQVAAQAITTIGFASGQFLSTYWRALVGRLGDGSLPGAFLVTGWCALALLGVLCAVSVGRRIKRGVKV